MCYEIIVISCSSKPPASNSRSWRSYVFGMSVHLSIYLYVHSNLNTISQERVAQTSRSPYVNRALVNVIRGFFEEIKGETFTKLT